MENWLIEVIKILAGAIAGVVLAEAFPSIKTFFKKSSLSYRERQINRIKKEYSSALPEREVRLSSVHGSAATRTRGAGTSGRRGASTSRYAPSRPFRLPWLLQSML